jgi:phosphoribosylanthranilate isomerase
LIDTFSPHVRGGTGVTFDWQQAKESISGAKVPIIIAGGLNPENVQQALATLEPWGVDATSGLESKPGKKDVQRLQAFCAAVRKFRQVEVPQLAKEKI